jgi:hypothetical protein
VDNQVGTISRKYSKAVIGVKESAAAFFELSQARSVEEQEKWASAADAAQDKRMENIKAMDIYETKGLKCRSIWRCCQYEN